MRRTLTKRGKGREEKSITLCNDALMKMQSKFVERHMFPDRKASHKHVLVLRVDARFSTKGLQIESSVSKPSDANKALLDGRKLLVARSL
jgi:hypothetical protein